MSKVCTSIDLKGENSLEDVILHDHFMQLLDETTIEVNLFKSNFYG